MQKEIQDCLRDLELEFRVGGDLYFGSFIVCGVVRLRADDEGRSKCSK